MKFYEYNINNISKSYGIDCYSPYSEDKSERPNYITTLCSMKPDDKSVKHSHFEPEQFIIIKGEITLKTLNKNIILKEGDQIVIPPFQAHQLINHTLEEVKFYSIYEKQNYVGVNKKNKLIISAPPTPNGRLHLGHISGPYLSADVYKRYYANTNVTSHHYSGTDDYQTYINVLAKNENKPIQSLLKKKHEEIKEDLESAQINCDYFESPSQNINYQKFILNKFKELIKSKSVKKVQISYPYDKKPKFEAFLKGECPNCNTETTGQCCEACGFVGSASQFNKKLKEKQFSVYSLDLCEFKDKLEVYLNTLNLNPKIYKRVQFWLKNLSTFQISYPDEVGLDGIHVWCEMGLGILFQRKLYKESIDQKNFELIYCFGIDNAFYYLILIPAIFIILGEESLLPSKVIINDFYNYNGSKFSTSSNNAIWMNEISSNRVDLLRLFLSKTRSEYTLGNFVLDEFEDFYALYSDKINFIKQYLSLDPKEDQDLNIGNSLKELIRKIINLAIQTEQLFEEAFSLNTYSQIILELIQTLEKTLPQLNYEELIKLKGFQHIITNIFNPILPNSFTSKESWLIDSRNINEKNI